VTVRHAFSPRLLRIFREPKDAYRPQMELQASVVLGYCRYPVSSEIDGKSPFFMGKLTISMVIFNSYVKLPEGIPFTPILS